MIHIVTVYDSLNYGSFFQAYALQKILGNYDNTDFLNIYHQSIGKETTKNVIKKIIKLQFKEAILSIKKYKTFKKSQKKFKLTSIRKLNSNSSDIFVFGSDEIWNINRQKIRKSKEFFGAGIHSERKFSYAPSINTTSINQIENNKYIKEELNKFLAISVRDSYSKKVISNVMNKEVSVVCDPTILVDKAEFTNIQSDIKDNKYILLYTYGKMLNENVINKIKKFSQERGLKIISIGKHFSFCDKSIVVTPEEFLGYIDNAEYVFTDNLHGTMFYIIYEKEFIVFPCGNTKVEEALNLFKLSERLVNNKKVSCNLDNIASQKIDYTMVNTIKNQIRIESNKYVNNSYNLCVNYHKK